MILYQDRLDRAAGRQNDFRRLGERLRKKRPRDLEEQARRLTSEGYALFDCLACARCCRGLGPRVEPADVLRLGRSLGCGPDRFQKQYLRQDEDGDLVFQAMPCPFLGADHYCTVYENRPRACAEYPHTDQRGFLARYALHLKNSRLCPIVAHVLESLCTLYPG